MQHSNVKFSWISGVGQAPVLGLPCISVPAGFTADGMPAGLHITGRPGADFEVLQVAHGYEQLTGFWRTSPEIPNRTRG